MRRRNFLFVLAAVAVMSVTPAIAGKPAVYTGVIDGVGAGGFDVVAYQTEEAAVPGDETITASHDGITYRFASEANRAAFEADPARYAPQFGGYCAWAVSRGYTAHGDPEAWSVVDERLYLNYSKGVRSQWVRDVSGNIAKGEANWPTVLE
ncbi:MAG: tat pathway signal sequence domain protein [Rhizobiaceae bacterium]|nr:tat pathway signal sequence domain protein [Rhizobiaceae bacterium]